MRRHPQCLQRSKETAVNNAIHTKESAKDLSTERCKRRRLEDTQRFFFIIVIWKLGFIVDLICYPMQYLFNVNRRRDGYCIPIGLGPTIFYAGGIAFPRTKGREEGIIGENCPDCGGVVVKINGVDGYPSSTAFSRRE